MAQADDATAPIRSPGLGVLLSRLSLMTRGWPGDALDPQATMRGVNLDGGKVPLVWVFNRLAELPALAGALAPDQPLAAMRSLNKVVAEPTRFRSHAVDLVSGHYARHLIDRLGDRPCVVGANCQAMTVAYRVALDLLAAGVPVRGFVTLDADVNLPLPVPVRVIFGAASHVNPRTIDPDAAYDPDRDLRRTLFPHRAFVETPGRHGGYFLPETVGPLSERILAALPAAPPPAGRPGIGWRMVERTAETVTLAAPLPPAVDDIAGLGVAPVMRREGETFLMRRTGPHRIALPTLEDGMLRATLALPDRPAGVRIRPLLCKAGVGPLTWPLEAQADIVL